MIFAKLFCATPFCTILFVLNGDPLCQDQMVADKSRSKIEACHCEHTGLSDCLQVLNELEVGHIPMITAWNKLDACEDPDQVSMCTSQFDSQSGQLKGLQPLF